LPATGKGVVLLSNSYTYNLSSIASQILQTAN
jgi:hypothetical protein